MAVHWGDWSSELVAKRYPRKSRTDAAGDTSARTVEADGRIGDQRFASSKASGLGWRHQG